MLAKKCLKSESHRSDKSSTRCISWTGICAMVLELPANDFGCVLGLERDWMRSTLSPEIGCALQELMVEKVVMWVSRDAVFRITNVRSMG